MSIKINRVNFNKALAKAWSPGSTKHARAIYKGVYHITSDGWYFEPTGGLGFILKVVNDATGSTKYVDLINNQLVNPIEVLKHQQLGLDRKLLTVKNRTKGEGITPKNQKGK